MWLEQWEGGALGPDSSFHSGWGPRLTFRAEQTPSFLWVGEENWASPRWSAETRWKVGTCGEERGRAGQENRGFDDWLQLGGGSEGEPRGVLSMSKNRTGSVRAAGGLRGHAVTKQLRTCWTAGLSQEAKRVPGS